MGMITLGTVISCSNSESEISNEIQVATAGKSTEEQIFQGINQYRSSRGKAALPRDPNLDRLARQQAEAMANAGKMKHGHFAKREGDARQFAGMQSVAENIGHVGKSSNSGATVVGLWINSSAHRSIILGHWRATGIGVAGAADGSVYMSQQFGR